MNKIALFDFDGTITKKDSLAEFIKFSLSTRTYYLGIFKLIPVIIKYKINLIPNYIAKEKLISHFFKNYDADQFKSIADQYSTEEIDKIVRATAIKKIQWHKAQEHKVVIVSASIESWLKKWCEKQGIDLIATRLEVKNGKITGQFETKNCYAIEKVNRIKERYNLSNYDYIYAYGDSSGDKQMLNLAHKSYYKPFR